MDFSLSEEQAMIRGTLSRFIAKRYGANEHRAYRAEPLGYDARNFATLAELGLFALPFSEASGGMGASLADIAVLIESLGHGLVVEPVLSRVLLAGCLLDRVGSDAARAAWMEDIVLGHRSLALAHGESSGGEPLIVRAGRLTGAASYVLDALGADGLAVICRNEAGQLKLAVVEVGAPGVVMKPFRLADGSWAAEVVFDEAVIDELQLSDCPPHQLSRLIAEASVAASAEMVGIMQRLLDDTVAYVQTRRQFGQPIGKFQAVQHRAARMFIAVEQSRSLLLKAVLTSPEDAAWPLAVASCRAFIADAALDVAHDAVQLHGGIGITDEVAVSFGHRRLMVLRKLFGAASPLLVGTVTPALEAA